MKKIVILFMFLGMLSSIAVASDNVGNTPFGKRIEIGYDTDKFNPTKNESNGMFGAMDDFKTEMKAFKLEHEDNRINWKLALLNATIIFVLMWGGPIILGIAFGIICVIIVCLQHYGLKLWKLMFGNVAS